MLANAAQADRILSLFPIARAGPPFRNRHSPYYLTNRIPPPSEFPGLLQLGTKVSYAVSRRSLFLSRCVPLISQFLVWPAFPLHFDLISWSFLQIPAIGTKSQDFEASAFSYSTFLSSPLSFKTLPWLRWVRAAKSIAPFSGEPILFFYRVIKKKHHAFSSL